MTKALPAALLTSLLLSTACPGDPGGEDAGPPAPDKDDLIAAYVDLFLRCSEWAPGSFLGELEPDVTADLRDRFEDRLTVAVSEILDNPNVVVNDDRIEACIAWAEQTECGVRQMPI